MAPFLSRIEGRPTAPNYITAAISGRLEHAWPIDDDVVAARWYDYVDLLQKVASNPEYFRRSMASASH
jgi:hypothetical protein